MLEGNHPIGEKINKLLLSPRLILSIISLTHAVAGPRMDVVEAVVVFRGYTGLYRAVASVDLNPFPLTIPFLGKELKPPPPPAEDEEKDGWVTLFVVNDELLACCRTSLFQFVNVVFVVTVVFVECVALPAELVDFFVISVLRFILPHTTDALHNYTRQWQ